MTTAHPLAWPDGWPRTPYAERKEGRSAFKRQQDTGRGYRSGQPWTFAAARDALLEEIGRQGALTCVISTNFQLDRRFLAVEGRRRPEDEGVAIYFERQGKPYVMACDRYHDAEGNMRSLTLALEALRQLERHGGGIMLERAFQGFTALPAPGGAAGPVQRPWRAVLGFSAEFPQQLTAGEAEMLVRGRYRTRAAELGAEHPDLLHLNLARDAALKELGA